MYTFKSEKELENIIRIDKSIPNKVIENPIVNTQFYVLKHISLHFNKILQNP